MYIMRRTTVIRVSLETRELLRKLGRKMETYDDIIRRLIKKELERGEVMHVQER